MVSSWIVEVGTAESSRSGTQIVNDLDLVAWACNDPSTLMPDHVANRKREKRGFEFLGKGIPGFYVPTSAEKDHLLQILGISRGFKQTFDAIRLAVPKFSDVKGAKDFDLIELKTTDEYLPNLPHGFFFGMTENEEMLLKVFEGKYLLCLVCLNEQCPGHYLVSWKELQTLIQNKRIQYQINLRAKSKAQSAGH